MNTDDTTVNDLGMDKLYDVSSWSVSSLLVIFDTNNILLFVR